MISERRMPLSFTLGALMKEILPLVGVDWTIDPFSALTFE